MEARTKPLELTIGVLGIVVGLAGIYATVLTFPGALDAVGSAISGAGLPGSFKGLAGGVTLFVIILTGVISLVALFFGLVCTVEQIVGSLSYPRPRVVAFSLVGALFWVSAFVTILMYSGFAAYAFFGASAAIGVPTFLVVGLAHAENR